MDEEGKRDRNGDGDGNGRREEGRERVRERSSCRSGEKQSRSIALSFRTSASSR